MRIKKNNKRNRLLVCFAMFVMITVLAVSCGRDDGDEDDDRDRRKPTVTAEPTGKAEPTEKAEPTPTPKEDYSKVKLPEDKIIFIDAYSNYAWGYADDGIFIDTNGDVWSYDFSQYYYPHYDEDKEDVVEHLDRDDLFRIIQKYTEPIAKIDIDILKEAYALGLKVDPDAEFKQKSMACDMGQYTLYFVNPETGEDVKIYSQGDTDFIPKDRYAKKLKKFYDKEFNISTKESKESYLYSADSIPFLNRCDFSIPKLTGKFMVRDSKALKRLAAESGVNVDEILGEMNEADMDMFTIFVEINSYSTGGYVDYASALMYYDGAVDFIPSSLNRAPEDREMVTEAFECYYHVAVFPYNYSLQESDKVTDFNGNEWVIYETPVATPDDAYPVPDVNDLVLE